MAGIAPVVCVQNNYGVDAYREQDAFVRLCGERGIAYVPFFALAGTGREAGASTAQGEAVEAVARAHGVTPQQVRLAWTLHQGPHVLAIPGTADPDAPGAEHRRRSPTPDPRRPDPSPLIVHPVTAQARTTCTTIS